MASTFRFGTAKKMCCEVVVPNLKVRVYNFVTWISSPLQLRSRLCVFVQVRLSMKLQLALIHDRVAPLSMRVVILKVEPFGQVIQRLMNLSGSGFNRRFETSSIGCYFLKFLTTSSCSGEIGPLCLYLQLLLGHSTFLT